MSHRVIVLLDMDCFYCQVEVGDDPSLQGVPLAVVQHNDWRGGGIIAVNYEARAMGVSRNMRGHDAREKCPEIKLITVPMEREKADLSKYRDAGKRVLDAIHEFNSGFIIERASVDEAYLDITTVVEKMEDIDIELPNTWVVGYPKEGIDPWLQDLNADDQRLAIGASIMEKVRQAVYDKTGYRCSAGIAHNKILAKVSCGLHKPNQQTLLPHSSVTILYESLKLRKLRGLGGKFGEHVTDLLHISTAKELSEIPLKTLQTNFDSKTSQWLYRLGQGLDDDPVKTRELPKSIGCSKNFRAPKVRLDTLEKVQRAIKMLADELSERLIKDRESYSRVARAINVSIAVDGHSGMVSRGGALYSYDSEGIAQRGLGLIQRLNAAESNGKENVTIWRPVITLLSLNASKFEESKGSRTPPSIMSFLSVKKDSEMKNNEPGTSNHSDDYNRINDDILSMNDVNEQSNELKDPLKASEKATTDSISSVNAVDMDFKEPSCLSSSSPETANVASIIPEEEGLSNDMIAPSTSTNSSSFVKEDSQDNSIMTNYASIDPSVLQHLPPEIRSEIEAEMQKQQQLDDPCPKCGKRISPFDLPEHLDLHVARDLQKDLLKQNREVVVASVPKRKSQSDADKKDSKKQKNILSFFNKI